MCVLSHFSHVWLFATLWTLAHQVPLSMGFSRPEYWSELPFPSPGDLPNPEMETMPLLSPAMASQFFPTSTTWEANFRIKSYYFSTSLCWKKKCISKNEMKMKGGILSEIKHWICTVNTIYNNKPGQCIMSLTCRKLPWGICSILSWQSGRLVWEMGGNESKKPRKIHQISSKNTYDNLYFIPSCLCVHGT